MQFNRLATSASVHAFAIFSLGCLGQLDSIGGGGETASLAGDGLNRDVLMQQGGAALSFNTQGISDHVNEFSGGLRVDVPIYRVGSTSGALHYINTLEDATIQTNYAEHNGLPFQWHRPWFARFSISNATRAHHGQVGTALIPQSAFVEFADGRRERLYARWHHSSDEGFPEARLRTSSFGEWERVGADALRVTSNDGTRYTFGNGPCFGTTDNTIGHCEATEIEDRFGEGVRIQYYGQSDSNRDNDSSIPRAVETYRRQASGLVVTGRAYFYLGSHVGNTGAVALPASAPADVFDLQCSVWGARNNFPIFNSDNRPTWSTNLAHYVRAIVYPGPESSRDTLDNSWHVTELHYVTGKHGFFNANHGVSGPYFDWVNLSEVVTEGERYGFRYDYLSRWPKKSPSIGTMGSLSRIVLPRLSTTIDYQWAFADNSSQNELVHRSVSHVRQDGTAEQTLHWYFRHQDVALLENGNNNSYRGSFTNHPTGLGTLNLFYPLAPDGTVMSARTGMIAESRSYMRPILATTPNTDAKYPLVAALDQLRAARVEQRGYAVYPIGPVLLEAPSPQTWTTWSINLELGSPITFSDLLNVYNHGYWQNTNFMGWAALPAFDVSSVVDDTATAPAIPCCLQGQVANMGNIYCQTTANVAPSRVCPEGQAAYASKYSCEHDISGVVCRAATFGDLSYWCQDTGHTGDYACPSGMTAVSVNACTNLGTCAAAIASAPTRQSVVRVYRENQAAQGADHILRPFVSYDPQFHITTVRRDDYDSFGHAPFVRQFVAQNSPTIVRTRVSCNAQARFAQGPSIFGWIYENADHSAGWSCQNDTITATPSTTLGTSQETRLRYLVEDSPQYWQGIPAFPMGVRNQLTRVQQCRLGVPLSSECAGSALYRQTDNDYDYRAVAYPFADAPGSAAQTALGRLTYSRELNTTSASESPEVYHRYYGNDDVAHEPHGALAETAVRVTANEYRRARSSYSDPLASAKLYAVQPMREWSIDTSGSAVLVARASYNNWGALLLATHENGFSVRSCYDARGRLIAEFDSFVAGDVACPTSDADSEKSRIRVWYDGMQNTVRTRQRTFFSGETIVQDSAAFFDGMGRTTLTQRARNTEAGIRLVTASTSYVANLSAPARQTVPYAIPGTLGTFGGYGFDRARRETSYDARGRATQTTVLHAGGAVAEQTIVRRGDTDPALALNVVVETDLEGTIGRTTHDPLGRALSTLRADNTTISTEYNERGLVERVVHPDGLVSVRHYDGLGRVDSSSSPEGGTATILYNRVSQPTESTDGAGVRIAYRYDARGRTVGIDRRIQSQTQVLRSWQYDSYPANSVLVGSQNASGRATRITFAGGAVDLGYDSIGNVISSVTNLTGLGAKRLNRTFDSVGGIRAENYQAGQSDAFSMRRTLNSNGELATLARVESGNARTLISHEYDGIGRIAYRDLLQGFAANQRENLLFDDLGRLTAVNDPQSLGTDAFAYRVAFENPTLGTARRDGMPSEMEWNTRTLGRAAYTFGYNANGALTTADFRNFTSSWQNPASFDLSAQYNSIGQFTSLARASSAGVSAATTFTYDSVSRRLQQTSGAVNTAFGYDQAGRVTDNSEWGVQNGTNREIGYTPFQRPSFVADGRRLLDIGYDHSDQQVRLAESTWQQPCTAANGNESRGAAGGCYVPGATRYIVRDSDGRPFAEYLGSTLARIYVPGLGTHVPSGNAESVPAGYYLAFADSLGSLRAVVHQSGTLVQAQDYDPFGVVLSSRDLNQSGSIFRGFASYRGRSEFATPFFLAGARLYHPGIGRFLSPDPLAATDPANTSYAYAYNNPVAFNDPSGLQGGPVSAFVGLFEGGPGYILPEAVITASYTIHVVVSAPAVVSVSDTALNMDRLRAAQRAWATLSGTAVVGRAGGNRMRPIREMVPNGPYVNPTYAPGPVIGNVFDGRSDAIQTMDGWNDPIFNLLTLGLGSGGVQSARVVARVGAHTPAVEQQVLNASQVAVRGMGNIGSHAAMEGSVALRAGERWLGAGYTEIANGVYRSADGLRQFRMTAADLLGSHGGMPHLHFEALNRAGKVIENLHIPLLGN